MASYSYVIVDDNGKEKKGVVEAKTLEQARAQVKKDGYVLVDLKEQGLLEKDINIKIGGAIKPRDYSVFCRQFSSMLRAGVTVVDALGMMVEATENKRLADGLKELQNNIEKGESMSASMKLQPKVFPTMLIQLVEAGEATGSLENSFDRMATQFEKEAKVKGLIKKAAIYPIIVAIVAVVVVIVMLVKVIPSYAQTFEALGEELPGITKAVMAASNFLMDYWYILLAIVVLAVVALKAFGTTYKGRCVYGKLSLKIPLFGNMNEKTASSLFARTLGTLLSAGIPMVDALEIVAKTMKNQLYEDALMEIRRQVSEGVPLSTPLKQCGLFPPMVCHMIRIGEETGDIDSMLDQLANYYDEEVEIATQSVMAALEPMIILLLAAIVVVIVAAIMAPMLKMYGAMDSL